jgi:hypothetical protein
MNSHPVNIVLSLCLIAASGTIRVVYLNRVFYTVGVGPVENRLHTDMVRMRNSILNENSSYQEITRVAIVNNIGWEHI